jgi:hypothetical protein
MVATKLESALHPGARRRGLDPDDLGETFCGATDNVPYLDMLIDEAWDAAKEATLFDRTAGAEAVSLTVVRIPASQHPQHTDAVAPASKCSERSENNP